MSEPAGDILKIGYFADGVWSHETFKKLIMDKTMKICFICGRNGKVDEQLRSLAKTHHIDYLRYANVNSKPIIAKIREFKCDLFVSMSFDQIFREEIINLPRLKIINCHAGKLPFYRGRNVLNWVLINDEKEFGVTVHYVDTGIDSGDIILQRTFPITDDDTYATLLKTAHLECANALYDAINLIKENKVSAIKQATIHPTGSYCRLRREGDEIVNWAQTSRELFNFIRAICKPGPMAKASLNGTEIRINKAGLVSDACSYKGAAGQILAKTDNGFIVKTRDSVLQVIEYEYAGQFKPGDKIR